MQKYLFAVVFENSCFSKFHTIHRKTPVLEYFLNEVYQAWTPATLLKRDFNAVVFLEYRKIFKNSLFSDYFCQWSFHNIFNHISPVMRQKGESQNGCFRKIKHAKFSEKQTFLTPWYAHSFAFLPMNCGRSSHFTHSENTKKPLVFWCFQMV